MDPTTMRYRPGKGLEVRSADGRHSIALGLRAMFLYELEHEAGVEAPDPTTTQQIQIRRARLTASGRMWGPDNQYKIELAFSPRDEAVNDDTFLTQTPLLTWVNVFTQLRDLELRVGQYKIPYSRERVVSSSKLSMVDRSNANAAFNLDRDIGFDLGSRDLGGWGWLQYNVGVYAGEGRGRFERNDLGMMYLARVNVTPMGLFDDYEPQDFAGGSPRLSVGAAYAFVDRPHGPKDILDGAPDGAIYAYHNLTADLVFKSGGFSTEAAVFWRGGQASLAEFAAGGTGMYVQPHLMLPGSSFGLAARYSTVAPSAVSSLAGASEAGLGLTYFIAGAQNHMKLQGDYLRSWAGSLGDDADQLRLQLQCMF